MSEDEVQNQAGDEGLSVETLRNENDEPYFELGQKKRVTVRSYKGTLLVDIREYYEKNGTMNPGRKGISLTLKQWSELSEIMDSINASIEEVAKIEENPAQGLPKKRKRVVES